MNISIIAEVPTGRVARHCVINTGLVAPQRCGLTLFIDNLVQTHMILCVE